MLLCIKISPPVHQEPEKGLEQGIENKFMPGPGVENDDAFYDLRTRNFGNAIDLLTGHASSIGRLILSE